MIMGTMLESPFYEVQVYIDTEDCMDIDLDTVCSGQLSHYLTVDGIKVVRLKPRKITVIKTSDLYEDSVEDAEFELEPKKVTTGNSKQKVAAVSYNGIPVTEHEFCTMPKKCLNRQCKVKLSKTKLHMCIVELPAEHSRKKTIKGWCPNCSKELSEQSKVSVTAIH